MPPLPPNYPTRRHFIEIHDQPWCPDVVRNAVVNILRQGWTLPYTPDVVRRHLAPVYTLVPVLRGILDRTPNVSGGDGDRRIVDLCSGMGGPMIDVARLMPDTEVSVSDLYPHPAEWQALTKGVPNASFVSRPVDACDVGASERGLRTIMAAYHHFPPPLAEKVLASAVHDGQPIAVVELTDRTVAGMVTIVLLTTLLGVLSGIHALFTGNLMVAAMTLLVPVNLFVLVVDGITSCWRTYTVPELHALAHAADPNGSFDWEVSERPASLPFVWWFKMRVLAGTPKRK